MEEDQWQRSGGTVEKLDQYRAQEVAYGHAGFIGAALTGLMILLFLRDVRTVIVVLASIPLALTGGELLPGFSAPVAGIFTM